MVSATLADVKLDAYYHKCIDDSGYCVHILNHIDLGLVCGNCLAKTERETTMRTHASKLVLLSVVLALLVYPLAAKGIDTAWHKVGPTVDPDDSAFASTTPIYPVAVRTNWEDGCAHIARFKWSYDQDGDKVWHLAYAYENDTGTHELTLFTLPAEIDDNEPLPYTNMFFAPWGVSMDMRYNSATAKTDVGVCFSFTRHYDYTPVSGSRTAKELLYVCYQHLEVQDGQVVMPIPPVQNVLSASGAPLIVASDSGPDSGLDSGGQPFLPCAGHASSVSVALDDNVRPYVVFSSNQFVWQHWLELEQCLRVQISYRYLNSANQWEGSEWVDWQTGFTDTLFSEEGDSPWVSGVSVAMDKAVIPNKACTAFPVWNNKADSVIYYTEFYSGFSSLDCETVAAGLPDCVYGNGRGVSLIIDDMNGSRLLGHDADPVSYKEKPAGGAWSAPVVLGISDTLLGSLGVTPGGYRVWATFFIREGSVISARWKNVSGGTWSSEMTVASHNVSGSENLTWTPVCDGVAWTNKPVVACSAVCDIDAVLSASAF